MLALGVVGFRSQIGPGQVGVAGQRGAGAAIHQEPYLRDARQVGVQRASNGEQR